MKQKNQTLLSLSIVLLSMCGFVGCYEPIDGCLNPLSANFSLTADNDCDDCCSFPSVSIRFFPLWDTFDLDTSSFYTTIDGDSLKITQSRFFIYNAYLSGESLPFLSSQDSVVLDCDPLITLYNTFQNVSLDDQTAQIPSVQLDEGYTSIHLDIGAPECLATIDTSLLTTLSSNTELFDNELDTDRYLTHQLNFAWRNDSTSMQTIQLVNDEGLLSVVFEKDFIIERGENLSIEIDVDYSKWFQSIVLEDSQETIKQKLIENSSGIFTLRD